MSTIGQRIKTLRTKNNLSLQELADLVGKSKGNISGYENDKYEPSAQTIISIAKYFGVSTDWILNGAEFQNNDYAPEESSNRVLISELESDMLQMFRLLDERDREDVFESIKSKYERTVKKGKTMSSYSTYTDTQKASKGDTNGKDSGIA
ncbi:putative repressor protein [uncultured Caudovirales phage]|uniref:Putative repressor protein n=1 Tax=uncultured Caudovirales phage TaxID=2100421 RepID=A0A2H4JAY7_9CAUD|nr:putative repressor protein [uncultured Caudovirales phage]